MIGKIKRNSVESCDDEIFCRKEKFSISVLLF